MDRYNITARTFPMLLFYLPVLLIAILFSIEIDEKIHVLTSFGVIAALSYFNAQLGRKGGKKREAGLWLAWGGAPATRLLRWSDDHIDPNTKKRYHFKMQAVCPVTPFPTKDTEAADRALADSAYQAWIKYLIAKTRNSKDFPLLFKENINYGFWRNLWGLKSAAVILLSALIAGIYLYFSFTTHNFNPLLFPKLFFITEAVMVIVLMVWLLVVTRDAVKIPAIGYAERLLESIDKINS